jgi:hypothetical protein
MRCVNIIYRDGDIIKADLFVSLQQIEITNETKNYEDQIYLIGSHSLCDLAGQCE